MHELAITQSMFELVMQEAEKAGATRVGKVNLVIGEMTGIVGDSVQFHFGFLSQGTAAEGAELTFTSMPPRARCHRCGKEFKLEEFEWRCPHCQHDSLELIGGKELYLESIEVE